MALFLSRRRKKVAARLRSCRPTCEPLEARIALTANAATPTLEVQLIPELDAYGNQIETIQVFEYDGLQQSTYAIYDTGASVITYSAYDNQIFELFETPIPIKVPGGAEAEAIGGPLIGDVSEPLRILADGLAAVNLVADDSGFFDFEIDISNAAIVEEIQTFVGSSQSSSLPTITGTPIHGNGLASRIDMQGFELDLGAMFPELPEFEGISLFLPNIEFVESGTPLDAGGPTISQPLRVPIELFGEDNLADPGDLISYTYNPVVAGVQLENTIDDAASTVEDQTFLFDTGAQLSVISTDIALGLNLDLDHPSTSITVQGAAGTAVIPGYVIDSLEVPHDDDGDGVVDGTIKFSDVPIFVLDIVDGIDGIWGMNLLNTAYQFQYDPLDPLGPSVTMTFDTDPFRELPLPEDEELSEEGVATVNALVDAFPPFAGVLATPSIPKFDTPAFDSGPLLQIGDAQQDDGGLSLEMLGTFDPQKLNLYDGGDEAIDLADAKLVGERVGEVTGSLVWDEATDRLRFIKTGGQLEPDTYRFTLYSRVGGLTDTAGRLLDGDGNGIAGGHFSHEFVVSDSTQPQLNLPDFLRAPAQKVDLAGSGGIPISLSEGDGVTQVSLAISYDAELLTIEDVIGAADLPADWQVEVTESTPGYIHVGASGETALPSGASGILSILADVPANATVGLAHVVELGSVSLNEGTVAGQGDTALHLVSLVGDASGQAGYSALDASLIARLAVGLDTGFDAIGNIDPLLVADVTGDGTISALDASFIARKAAGLDQVEIPDISGIESPSQLSSSPAPNVYIAAEDLANKQAEEEAAPVNASGGFLPTDFEALPPHVQEIFIAAGRGPESNEPTSDPNVDSEEEARDELFALIGSEELSA